MALKFKPEALFKGASKKAPAKKAAAAKKVLGGWSCHRSGRPAGAPLSHTAHIPPPRPHHLQSSQVVKPSGGSKTTRGWLGGAGGAQNLDKWYGEYLAAPMLRWGPRRRQRAAHRASAHWASSPGSPGRAQQAIGRQPAACRRVLGSGWCGGGSGSHGQRHGVRADAASCTDHFASSAPQRAQHGTAAQCRVAAATTTCACTTPTAPQGCRVVLPPAFRATPPC
jgi:hypothetical protein